MSVDGISGISSIRSNPVGAVDNATGNIGNATGKDSFFNLFVSQDRDGTVFHELAITTGNIDTCKISSIKDAEIIINSGETFKIAQPDKNQPTYLTDGIKGVTKGNISSIA
jgi:hypothetical protein